MNDWLNDVKLEHIFWDKFDAYGYKFNYNDHTFVLVR